MNRETWRIDGTTATLAGATAMVDVQNPALGVQFAPAEAAGAAVFGVQPPGSQLQLKDCYTRGDDLVAHYRPTDDFPFRTEIYWRTTPAVGESPATLSLILSVETDLLDTAPELLVVSRTVATELTPLAVRAADAAPALEPTAAAQAAALLVPGFNAGQSWFEAVHPTDSEQAQLETRRVADQTEASWRLFSCFLEKGVIRRARLGGALLAGPDLAMATKRYTEFTQQAPPLTV